MKQVTTRGRPGGLPSKGRCVHVKPDGSGCRALPRTGRPFCTFHDPEVAGERAEGRRRGGVNRSEKAATLPPDAPPLPLTTVGDVTSALAEAYNSVRTGRLAVNVGNCLAVIGQALLKAMEKSDLEARLAALEQRQSTGRRIA
jgi:hypothetical protein